MRKIRTESARTLVGLTFMLKIDMAETDKGSLHNIIKGNELIGT